MENILVPLDFSENSFNALEFAGEIAGRSAAKVMLYHALSDEKKISTTQKIRSILEKMENYCMDLRQNYSKINTCTECTMPGKPVDTILNLVENNYIDLIIMASRSAEGDKLPVTGSITSAIINSKVCPVLSIPGDAIFHEINKIAFLTDENILNLKSSLDFIKELAELFDAEVKLINISHGMNEEIYEANMALQAEENIFGKNVDHSFDAIHTTDPEKGIYEFLLENGDIDVLASSTRKFSMIEKAVSADFTGITASTALLFLPE